MFKKERKQLLLLLMIGLALGTVFNNASAAPPESKMYFELKVYHYTTNQQETLIDNFVKSSFIPYLHSAGINNIGVFKAIANDTATVKKLYVLIPFKSLKQWQKYLKTRFDNPAVTGNTDYVNGVTSNPSYARIETIFMQAFKFMPKMSAPKLTTPKSERVYELRSYESASEKVHVNKVHMFNEGGEIDIFDRLGFNAVFYGSVIHGAKMPNLIYMTSFDNKKSRDEHWAAFRDDPAWKTLSAKPEYQKNVSKNETSFLRPTEYSEL